MGVTHGIKLEYSPRIKNRDNGFVESLNGRLRDECLNQEYFRCPGRSPESHRGVAPDYHCNLAHTDLGWQSLDALRATQQSSTTIGITNLSLVP